MVPRSQRLVRRLRLVPAIVSIAAACCSVAGAGAASLGGISGPSLRAMAFIATNVAPRILACDNFALNSSSGQSLGGRLVQAPARCGAAQWKIDGGSWKINQGLADPNNATALVSVPVGQTDMSSQATLVNASGGSRIGGVMVSVSNNGSTYLVGTISAQGQVQVRIVNNNTSTTLATATVTIPTDATLRLTRNGAAVTLKVGTTTAISLSLSAPQVTLLSTGTRAGMFWDRGNPVRFSNFLATTPSP